VRQGRGKREKCRKGKKKKKSCYVQGPSKNVGSSLKRGDGKGCADRGEKKEDEEEKDVGGGGGGAKMRSKGMLSLVCIEEISPPRGKD